MTNSYKKLKKHCYKTQLQKITNNYLSWDLESLVNLYKIGTLRMDCCYIAARFTSPKVKTTTCDDESFKYTMIYLQQDILEGGKHTN